MYNQGWEVKVVYRIGTVIDVSGFGLSVVVNMYGDDPGYITVMYLGPTIFDQDDRVYSVPKSFVLELICE